MVELRDLLQASFRDLEIMVFEELAAQYLAILQQVLGSLDELLWADRDRDRFVVKDQRPMISHEAVRQQVLAAGRLIMRAERRRRYTVQGKRRVPILFIEAEKPMVSTPICNGTHGAGWSNQSLSVMKGGNYAPGVAPSMSWLTGTTT